jgi:DNA-directed RNA polymerase subunit RPC12/RpoP
MHSDRDRHSQQHLQPPARKRIDAGCEQPPALEPSAPPDQLHICFRCSGRLVYPLSWSEGARGQWQLELRCPDCESRREGVFEQAVVERLDDELERAASALVGDLRRLTHANMAQEIEFFIRALDADLIDPSDF